MRPVRKANNLTTILCRCHEIWYPSLPGSLWATPGNSVPLHVNYAVAHPRSLCFAAKTKDKLHQNKDSSLWDVILCCCLVDLIGGLRESRQDFRSVKNQESASVFEPTPIRQKKIWRITSASTLIQASRGFSNIWYKHHVISAIFDTSHTWFQKYLIQASRDFSNIWYKRHVISAIFDTSIS